MAEEQKEEVKEEIKEEIEEDSEEKIDLTSSEDEKDKSEEDIPKDEEEVAVKKEVINPEFDSWQPKTTMGKKVKSGEIKDIDQILDNGEKILESEIVDILLPNLESELLLIGQSKGKFGGGQRRVFKQTQKKTC
jgi:hypothetical protein